MASLTSRPDAFLQLPADRRVAGLALTLLVHAVLVLGWQFARRLPAPEEGLDTAIQWLRLPPPAAAPVEAPPSPAVPQPATTARGGRPAPSAPAAVETAPAPVTGEAAQASEAPASAAESIVENARRSAGDIARALRKESRPLIVAPPDSPQIRLRQGMEHAHAMARPRVWEAPKVEELVNNTGDGARRTRVVTGRGTYCITQRAPTTNVEMIQMHGWTRLTNCPAHEEPAKPQEWRTARD